jgi:hypothetical protein
MGVKVERRWRMRVKLARRVWRIWRRREEMKMGAIVQEEEDRDLEQDKVVAEESRLGVKVRPQKEEAVAPSELEKEEELRREQDLDLSLMCAGTNKGPAWPSGKSRRTGSHWDGERSKLIHRSALFDKLLRGEKKGSFPLLYSIFRGWNFCISVLVQCIFFSARGPCGGS